MRLRGGRRRVRCRVALWDGPDAEPEHGSAAPPRDGGRAAVTRRGRTPRHHRAPTAAARRFLAVVSKRRHPPAAESRGRSSQWSRHELLSRRAPPSSLPVLSPDGGVARPFLAVVRPLIPFRRRRVPPGPSYPDGGRAYIYVESQGWTYNLDDTFGLVSPTFARSTSDDEFGEFDGLWVRFSYFMYGGQVGSLALSERSVSDTDDDAAWSEAGSRGRGACSQKGDDDCLVFVPRSVTAKHRGCPRRGRGGFAMARVVRKLWDDRLRTVTTEVRIMVASSALLVSLDH